MYLIFKYKSGDEKDRERIKKLVGGDFYEGDIEKHNGKWIYDVPRVKISLKIKALVSSLKCNAQGYQ